MDVVAGETAGVEGQLLLLYHVLFILQVYRVWVRSMAPVIAKRMVKIKRWTSHSILHLCYASHIHDFNQQL
jgi:hypothetical protein